MNKFGPLRCDLCDFRSFTRAGINTHYGKKHRNPPERAQRRREMDTSNNEAKGAVTLRIGRHQDADFPHQLWAEDGFVADTLTLMITGRGEEAKGQALARRNRDNARRLAACWNACIDLRTESIESLVEAGGVKRLIDYVGVLQQEDKIERGLAIAGARTTIEVLSLPLGFHPDRETGRPMWDTGRTAQLGTDEETAQKLLDIAIAVQYLDRLKLIEWIPSMEMFISFKPEIDQLVERREVRV